MTNINKIKLTKVDMSSERDPHSGDCVICVYSYIIIVEFTSLKLPKNDASCILMTEAVIVSNVIGIPSLVSEIWLATKRQTKIQSRFLPQSLQGHLSLEKSLKTFLESRQEIRPKAERYTLQMPSQT